MSPFSARDDSGAGFGSPRQQTGRDDAVKKDTVKCIVVRDYWTSENDRVRAGTIVDLPMDEALDRIDAGIVARHKAEAK